MLTAPAAVNESEPSFELIGALTKISPLPEPALPIVEIVIAYPLLSPAIKVATLTYEGELP